MQLFNHNLKRQHVWRGLKSFGTYFLAAATLAIGAFALAYFRNQFDNRSPEQSAMAYAHYPSDFEP